MVCRIAQNKFPIKTGTGILELPIPASSEKCKD
jgi:hypothetical protein